MSEPKIMVDELQRFPGARAPFANGSCHLTVEGTGAEALDALHAFAAQLGLRRPWFQPARSPNIGAHHYDLVPSKRALALRLGAVFVPAKEQALARIEARRATT